MDASVSRCASPSSRRRPSSASRYSGSASACLPCLYSTAARSIDDSVRFLLLAMPAAIAAKKADDDHENEG